MLAVDETRDDRTSARLPGLCISCLTQHVPDVWEATVRVVVFHNWMCGLNSGASLLLGHGQRVLPINTVMSNVSYR